MINVIFRVALYTWKDMDEFRNPVPVDLPVDYIGENLDWFNFSVDLNQYADSKERRRMRTILILPTGIYQDLAGQYVEIHAFSNADILEPKNIKAMEEYIKGQVSDGWGENDFDIGEDYHMKLNWLDVAYKGHGFMVDEDFDKMVKDWKNNMKTYLEDDSDAYPYTIPEANPHYMTEEDYVKATEQAAEELQELLEKLEGLDAVEQLEILKDMVEDRNK